MKRHGFTLVELLVVITIIGILIALLLPAVQSAREAARRLQCSNHLKQISLAMLSYESQTGYLPVNGPDDSQKSRGQNVIDSIQSRDKSWMTWILPFIEQQNLYNQIEWDEPLSHVANTQVAKTPVATFICPSDDNASGIANYRDLHHDDEYWGVQNYKAVAGSNWASGAFQHASTVGRNANSKDGLKRGNGIICSGASSGVTSTPLAHIRDGLSNTFAVGEAVPAWCDHTMWWHWNATTATCAIPLNYKPPGKTREENFSYWPDNYSFMSRHVGGGSFAMCDGSVHFISDSIDLTLYRNLATISGGESVSLP